MNTYLSADRMFLLLCCLLFSHLALAVDKVEVKSKHHTQYDLYLTAQEAFDMKKAQADKVLFLDVRTRPEIQYAGFADSVDANIPIFLYTNEWKMKKDGVHGSYRKRYNKQFVAAVDSLLKQKNKDKSVPIIIMCQSGGRGPLAAKKLHQAGYEKVYFQVEGFEGIKAKEGPDKGKRVIAGWKHDGLPWSYKLPADKMYFNFAAAAE